MMTFLRDIAKEENIAVVCTIHQPPASVFAGFDSMMLLSLGRVAYCGKAASMGEYFESIGSPPPPDTNVAEFALDLVNKDFTPLESVVAILDRWAERGGAPYGGSTSTGEASEFVLGQTKAGFGKQVGGGGARARGVRRHTGSRWPGSPVAPAFLHAGPALTTSAPNHR